MSEVDELRELSKILNAFGNFRKNLSKEHNDFVNTQLLKAYEVVTKTFMLQGKEYTGTYKEDVRRKFNKEAYAKESKLATVLASFGFDVYLIEEDNSLPGKKPDAIVNGIVMDFKEIKALDEKEVGKNALGSNYQRAMKKQHVHGVAMFLHSFSNEFVKENMKGKTSTGKNGLALFFHEDSGTLQLLDMQKIRTAHEEQSRLAGHPNRRPNDLRNSESVKCSSARSSVAICKNGTSDLFQKSSASEKHKNKSKKPKGKSYGFER